MWGLECHLTGKVGNLSPSGKVFVLAGMFTIKVLSRGQSKEALRLSTRATS